MVGSRWYKFDFHNHTPASHDYKIPDISPREWLLAYMKQHVDCVVISDHNSGAWVDVLKGELRICPGTPAPATCRNFGH